MQWLRLTLAQKQLVTVFNDNTVASGEKEPVLSNSFVAAFETPILARRARYSWEFAGSIIFWPCLFCGWVFSWLFLFGIWWLQVGMLWCFLTFWWNLHFRKSKHILAAVSRSIPQIWAGRASTPWVWSSFWKDQCSLLSAIWCDSTWTHTDVIRHFSQGVT